MFFSAAMTQVVFSEKHIIYQWVGIFLNMVKEISGLGGPLCDISSLEGILFYWTKTSLQHPSAAAAVIYVTSSIAMEF